MKNLDYRTHDTTQIKDGRVVFLNRYFLCKDGDPRQAVFFKHNAQCNEHKSIVHKLKGYAEKQTGWNIEVRFLEVAYIPNPYY